MATVRFSENTPIHNPTGVFRKRAKGTSSRVPKPHKARKKRWVPPRDLNSDITSPVNPNTTQPANVMVDSNQLDDDASVVGVSVIKEFIWPIMIIIAFVACVVYLSIYMGEVSDEIAAESISDPAPEVQSRTVLQQLKKQQQRQRQRKEKGKQEKEGENFIGFDWAQFDRDESEDEKKEAVVGVRSEADGKKYKVAATLEHGKEVANMFAEMNKKSQQVMRELAKDLDDEGQIISKDGKDITMEMKRLVDRHMNKPIPIAEYRSPESKTVGANQGKGDIIEVCARSRYDADSLNDRNTMFRVVLHELAHSADKKYQEEDSHGKNFERIHSHLLGIAQEQGTFSCEQYMQNGKQFCSLVLTEDYC